MTKKKQEQQEQSQDEHVMAVLDKRTNKTAVISKMNEQDGSIEVVPPDKKNNSSFLKLDRTTPLELFFTNFKNQYQNPTSFSFFPCSSRHVGQGAERGHPDPERGRPRTGRQEDGGELRTQRRGTYRQTGPAV